VVSDDMSKIGLLAKKPDYLIVMPWHFWKCFEKNKRCSPFKLVLPLPQLKLMSNKDGGAAL
jgi:hypothetical protein